MKSFVLVMALTFGLALPAFAQSADEIALRDIEQRLHDAKLKNDVGTLDRYLHVDYFGTNQTGNQRDKQKILTLFKTFPIQSLSTNVLRVRVTGDTAVVTGTLDERSGTGNDHMLFTHTYLANRRRLAAGRRASIRVRRQRTVRRDHWTINARDVYPARSRRRTCRDTCRSICRRLGRDPLRPHC